MRFTIAAMLAIVATGLVAGCGRQDASADRMSNKGGATADEVQANTRYSEAAKAMPAFGTGGADAPLHTAARQPGAERSVMRSAALTVEVNELEKSEKQLRDAIKSNGGYVDHENGEDLGGDQPVMHLTIRVPEKNFEDLLTAIQALGKRNQMTISASDLTEQILEKEARLQQLQREQDTLTKQNVPYNTGFSSIKDRIKELQDQKNEMMQQAAMAKVDLTLQQKHDPRAAVAASSDWSSDTWNSASSSATVAYRFFGTIAIWLLAYSPIWGLAGVAVLLGLRMRKRMIVS